MGMVYTFFLMCLFWDLFKLADAQYVGGGGGGGWAGGKKEKRGGGGGGLILSDKINKLGGALING